MPLSTKDTTLLRDLASRVADLAALPVQDELRTQWTALNGLRPVRPMVSIFQVPWHEMNVNGELDLHAEDPWARGMENGLRMQLYQWDHFRDDTIIEAAVPCQLAFSDTGFGVGEISDVNSSSGLASRHFHEQFKTLDDVQKIKLPEVTYDAAATEESFSRLSELFDGIRPVRKHGMSHMWFAPWDLLITWYGVQTAMMDMVLNPELVNACMERLVDGYLHRLQQWEDLNVLTLPMDAGGAGSGGIAMTDELPQPGYNPDRITTMDVWGCATPQIFSEISPEMHWEFALKHEMRWLERWGLNYYGCCEPLHTKVQMLKQVPRLRKLSCSPKCDKVSMAEQCGRDYVISLKPNPAIFAGSYWSPEVARREIREDLDKLQGCVVEIVLKDISTVSGVPQRLWEWARIAREEAERFGG